jgi:hypothetical protein
MQWEVGSEFEIRDSALVVRAERDMMSPQAWRLPPGECRLVQNGRAALLTALRDACLGAKLTEAWLPSYLCTSMVQPFRQLGLDVHYYRVGGSLAPVDGVWAREVSNGSVVLYVNYFGLPVSATARSLAQQHKDRGVVTILDMTHSLFNTVPDEIQETSYCAASLRKWVGLPDGGLVWKRGSRFSVLPDANSTDGGFGRARLVAGLMKGLYCDSVLPQKDGFRMLFGIAEDLARRCTTAVPMSRVSRLLWSQVDTTAVVSARRANYAVLASGISGLRSIRLFAEELPQGVCPLGCPVLSPYRDDLRVFLTGRSVYCPVHWQLPDEIQCGFPASVSIAEEVLTVPCDQRYAISDMNRIVALLTEWDKMHLSARDGDVV